MHNLKFILLLLLAISSISHSQFKSDFMISDSARIPYFDFDNNGIIHMVWANDQKRDKSARYSALDSIGNVIHQARRISSTIFAANPRLDINDSLVACIWEDRVSLDLTIFSTYIKGKILKDGLDYSDEVQIDDGDLVPNDALLGGPEIIWHNDNILFAVWCGDGSRSPTDYSDIYMHKLKFPPLQKSKPLDEVLNNPFISVTEGLPTIIRKSSGTGYLVIWIEKDSLSILRVAGVSCDDSLNVVSSKIVFLNLDSMKYYIGKPAIFHRDNNIVIVWEKDTLQISQSNIYYQEFTEEGVPVSEIIKVNDINASEANSVSADIDNDGNIIIVWEGWPDLYGQRYS